MSNHWGKQCFMRDKSLQKSLLTNSYCEKVAKLRQIMAKMTKIGINLDNNWTNCSDR